jgi:phage replication-related protein YjqB (UPF0714/DUF867 family)
VIADVVVMIDEGVDSDEVKEFDEPQCLELIARCDIVLAMHGRKDDGDSTAIFVGGLNDDLGKSISAELISSGFPATTENRKFPGRDPSNILQQREDGIRRPVGNTTQRAERTRQ